MSGFDIYDSTYPCQCSGSVSQWVRFSDLSDETNLPSQHTALPLLMGVFAALKKKILVETPNLDFQHRVELTDETLVPSQQLKWRVRAFCCFFLPQKVAVEKLSEGGKSRRRIRNLTKMKIK